MPDHFVPLDTTKFTRMYRQMAAKSIVLNANLKYIDKHRKQLKKTYPTFEEFRVRYELPEEVIAGVMAEAEKAKIKPADDEERERTVKTLKLQMKALVARDLWDMSEYFAVYNEQNDIVKKAVELLK